jgi:hypothetical protein
MLSRRFAGSSSAAGPCVVLISDIAPVHTSQCTCQRLATQNKDQCHCNHCNQYMSVADGNHLWTVRHQCNWKLQFRETAGGPAGVRRTCTSRAVASRESDVSDLRNLMLCCAPCNEAPSPRNVQRTRACSSWPTQDLPHAPPLEARLLSSKFHLCRNSLESPHLRPPAVPTCCSTLQLQGT